MNHTPGPWKVSPYHKSVLQAEVSRDGCSLSIADMAQCSGPMHPRGFSEANARLIAAAPELLEALQALTTIARMYHKGEAPGHLDTCENPDNCGHCLAMRKVNAAIARATGKDADR